MKKMTNFLLIGLLFLIVLVTTVLYYVKFAYWHIVLGVLILLFLIVFRNYRKKLTIRPQKINNVSKIASLIVEIIGRNNIKSIEKDNRTIIIKVPSDLEIDLNKIRNIGVSGVLRLDLETIKLISRDETDSLFEALEVLL